MPNQRIFIDAIPLQESRASSEIEDIVASQDEIYKACVAGEGAADQGVREVVRYRAALNAGAGKPLSAALMEEICSVLMGREMRMRRGGEQVHLRGSDGRIAYTPPSGHMVAPLIDDLTRYLAGGEGTDPLIRMAASHVQFESIHPFMDGNGRTGRILNSIYLQRAGLLDSPILFMSRYLVGNRRDYYRLLARVRRDGEWERWILFMLDAAEDAAGRAMAQIRAMESLRRDIEDECGSLPFFSKELMDVLFGGVYCKIGSVVDAGIAGRNTASRYLERLEGMGVLRSEKAGRERIYLNVRLGEILSG
jgi:Fic family protein